MQVKLSDSFRPVYLQREISHYITTKCCWTVGLSRAQEFWLSCPSLLCRSTWSYSSWQFFSVIICQLLPRASRKPANLTQLEMWNSHFRLVGEQSDVTEDKCNSEKGFWIVKRGWGWGPHILVTFFKSEMLSLAFFKFCTPLNTGKLPKVLLDVIEWNYEELFLMLLFLDQMCFFHHIDQRTIVQHPKLWLLLSSTKV